MGPLKGLCPVPGTGPHNTEHIWQALAGRGKAWENEVMTWPKKKGNLVSTGIDLLAQFSMCLYCFDLVNTIKCKLFWKIPSGTDWHTGICISATVTIHADRKYAMLKWHHIVSLLSFFFPLPILDRILCPKIFVNQSSNTDMSNRSQVNTSKLPIYFHFYTSR